MVAILQCCVRRCGPFTVDVSPHMKRVAIASASFLAALSALVALVLWFLPSDVVESSYPTLDSARRDRLFDRGWLPEIIPPSTSRISVSSNLDLNTSWGSFEFHPKEWDLLEGRLTRGELSAPFADWQATVAENRDKGFQPWHHASADTRWVFFCRPDVGRCEYVMWMPREG